MICGEKLKINLRLNEMFMRRNSVFLQKVVLLFVFMFVFLNTNLAVTYYVSNVGNDANSGSSESAPWRTIAKVNSAALNSGDVILFRRGDTFFGQLIPSRSYITFDAYGVGAKPVISGFQTVTGWVSQGNGIYAAPALAKTSCNLVTVNGVNTPMGRFPKTGWLTFESAVGRTSITDNQLGSSPNWTGAEVVIKKRDFIIDRSVITDHSSTTISYTSGSPNNPVENGGYNYFIQKSINALSQLGDWYCNGTSLYMYFGSNNPNNYVVKTSVVDRLISINSKNTNVFRNLAIEGSNIQAVYFTLSSNIQFISCDFNNHGSLGILGAGSTSISIDGCTFSNCNGKAIDINAANSSIKNSIFSNIGLIPGMGESNGDSYSGIKFGSENGIIEYNEITNFGSIPIYFYGNNSKVRFNKVDGFGSIINYGGGIYTYKYNSTPASIGLEVYRNVLMNGRSNGLYADGVSNNVSFHDNTIISMAQSGIHMTTPISNSVGNNLFYNCAVSGVSMTNIYTPEAGTVARNNTILNNVFMQNSASQLFIRLTDTKNYAIGNFGTSNYNAIIVGSDGLNLFKTEANQPSSSTNLYTISTWKTFSNQELNSTQTVTNLSEVQFEYNATKSAKTIALSSSMVDAKGVKYSGSITLQPYTSVLLMKDQVVSAPAVTGAYYVSSLGNDSNSGLSPNSPWKTIAKVNSVTLKPGSSVLFRRGDTFYGTLIPRNSGTSTSYITYGAYGSGAKPIISSFERLTTWTSVGNGIYSSPTNAKSAINIVSVNGTNVPMGRYPKADWLTFESFVGRTSLTDNQLSSSPNWTGAEVVVCKSNWIIDRSLITNHTGGKITYSSGSTFDPTIDGEYRYFIQNHIGTLTKLYDWYSKGSTFYMYFGTANPSTYFVKVPISDVLVDVSSKSYLTFDNIAFEGGNKKGLVTYLAIGINIKNCDFNYMGDNAIYSTSSQKTLVENCVINNCNGTSLYLNSVNSIIRNNVISNGGLTPGMGNADGQTYNGITFYGTGGICEYNTIKDIGYNGIMFYSNNSVVRYNFIDGFCKFLFDGGGIYTYLGGSSTIVQSGMKVYNNIVLNGGGNGLYSDGITNNLEIYNNSVANVLKWGIHMNQPRYNKVQNNSFYNCTRSGIDLQNLYFSEVMAANNSISANIVVQGTTNQILTSLTDIRTYNIGYFGTSNYNYFVAGSDGLSLFRTQVSIPKFLITNYTFPLWKIFSGQEANSTLMFTNLADIRFEYNATKAAKVITLTEPMVDPKGVKYSSTVTLQPYTSIILMKAVALKSGSIPVDQSLLSATDATNIDAKVSVSLYPNPTLGRFTVSFSQLPVSGSKIEIFDLVGRKISSRIISNTIEVFELNNLQAGLYVVKSTLGAEEFNQKLIVNK